MTNNEKIARFRHIAMNMGGTQQCEDGTRWHPAELMVLLDELESLNQRQTRSDGELAIASHSDCGRTCGM